MTETIQSEEVQKESNPGQMKCSGRAFPKDLSSNTLMVLHAVAAHSYLGDGLGASPPEIAHIVQIAYSRSIGAFTMDKAILYGILKRGAFGGRLHLTDRGLKLWNERVRLVVNPSTIPSREVRVNNGEDKSETMEDLLDSLHEFFVANSFYSWPSLSKSQKKWG